LLLQPQPYRVVKPPIPILDGAPSADHQDLPALGQGIQGLAHYISRLTLSLFSHGGDQGTHGIQTAADNLAGHDYFYSHFFDLLIERAASMVACIPIGLITHGHALEDYEWECRR